jgi:hypothetical protein
VPAVTIVAVMSSRSTGVARTARPTGLTGVTWLTRTARPTRVTGPTRVTWTSGAWSAWIARASGPTRVTRTTGASWATRPWSESSVAAPKATAVATTTKATAAVAATAPKAAATTAATTTAAATATATQRGWYRVMKRGRGTLAAGTGQRARNGACRSCSCSHDDCRECSGDGGSGHQLVRSHHRDFCLLRAYRAPDWTKSTLHRLSMD